MILGIHFLDDTLQDAVLVKDERLAERAHRYLAVVAFLAPRAKGLEESFSVEEK